MEQFKQEIKLAARESLADLVGFASWKRFVGMEDKDNPFSLYPQAKTAILIARRITRGSLRGVEEGINFGDYSMFGKNWLADEFIAQTIYNVASFIERTGWEAMPLMPDQKTAASGADCRVEPDFSWAAVACGLGEIGLSGEVLTPQYGPRQRFAMILTDAELPDDPLLDKPVCNRCGRCVQICPLHALDGEHMQTITICNRSMLVAGQNPELCNKCGNGFNGVATAKSRGKGDRLAALCTRTCVQALEEAGRLENKFETRFRKRQPWGLNAMGEPAVIVEGEKQCF